MENENKIAVIKDGVMSNEKCVITFSEFQIRGRDKTDEYNQPVFFSRSKRGLKKGWEKLKQEFNDETTMYSAMRILGEAGIKTHSYCAVD